MLDWKLMRRIRRWERWSYADMRLSISYGATALIAAVFEWWGVALVLCVASLFWRWGAAVADRVVRDLRRRAGDGE